MNDPQIYDSIYAVGGHKSEYHKRYTKSRYYPMWHQVFLWVKQLRKPKVLDIGCGVGQFAQLLIDNGIMQYHGIDFSKVAIAIAKQKHPEKFQCVDALQYQGYYGDFNAVCLLEVLEHIPNDKLLLARLKSGSTVIISVPNYDSETHIRFFDNAREVQRRYRHLINFDQESFEFEQGNGKKIFLLRGIKL